MMKSTYLLLGSNMGNCKLQFRKAQQFIEKKIGPIIRQSSLYQTAAWGNNNQPDFLNQIIIVETQLNAETTLDKILEIELKMGRIRTEKNAPRVIDIDILFFEKEIIQTENLVVPHPEIQNRRFVLIPLNELSPNLKHPTLSKTTHQLLKDCKDTLEVRKII